MPVECSLRLMRTADVATAERLTDEAFYALEQRIRRPDAPPPARRAEAQASTWRLRARHVLNHDSKGCWVAENDSGLIGMATSIRRDLTWILSTLAVRPDLQGQGVGRRLLEAASAYGRGCLRGMLAASDDSGALRRYRQAGFALHPTMVLRGRVDRALLPVVDRTREGSAADIDLMNSVDRQVRDSAHGVDHELLAELFPLVVVDRPTGSGYAYVEPEGGPYLLAATNRRTATTLLWETLAATSPETPCSFGYISPAQEWAVDVGLEARLSLDTEGYLALRGMKPPAPYLPSGHFL